MDGRDKPGHDKMRSEIRHHAPEPTPDRRFACRHRARRHRHCLRAGTARADRCRAAAVLCAGGAARGAGGGQCLCAKVVQTRSPLFDDPIFQRFFGAPGGGGSQLQRSLGSGVIVKSRASSSPTTTSSRTDDEVKVLLSDHREFEATLVLKDSRTDLAVLRIKDARERFPTLDFANSDALEVGDMVLAIGNPFGVGQTVTHGIVRRSPAPKSASPTISSSSRPTPLSIPAIPAARWSISPAGWSASIPRSSRARAARSASVSLSPAIWCAWWWPRPRAAAAR